MHRDQGIGTVLHKNKVKHLPSIDNVKQSEITPRIVCKRILTSR